jgi:hypothetical protein
MENGILETGKLQAAFAAFCLLCSSTIAAQAPQQGPLIFDIDGGAAHQSMTDLKDSEGSFAVDRWFVSAGITYAWDRRNALGFTLGGGSSSYEFDDLTGPAGSEPWNKIEETRAAITGRFSFSEKGTAIIIPTVRFNGEEGASSSDSRTFGLFAAAAWRIDENLTIGPGIGVFSRLEDSARVFPILVIDWNISERWSLSTGRGLAASQGPGLTLSYEMNKNWSFGLSGRYENIEFRLDDEGPAPGGVGRDRSLPLVASANLYINPRINLSVFAGLEFAGELRMKDAMDVTVDERKYDPAPLFGATFAVRF